MTAVPKWLPGTLYLPGALVQPASALPSTPAALTNTGFESGDTGWTKGAGWTISTGESFSGSYAGKYDGAVHAEDDIVNDDRIAITPGESVSATCMVNQGASSANDAGAAVRLYWYDSGGSLLSYKEGTIIKSGSNGEYKRSSVTGTCPAGAAKFSVGARAFHDGSGQPLYVDDFTVTYTPRSIPEGLILRAVQTDPGTSGNAEPAWPTTLGLTVVDNEVTWEAVDATRVTWQASPILKSGSSEPDWPTTPGAMVSDGTVLWECFTRRVEDENCPNSKVVQLAASKVYAGNDDIIRYSATINPLDWTSANDAGYLPYGLQTYGSNPVAAMGLYRGYLAAFNSEGMQMWQVDEDPALSTLLDALPLGSSHHLATVPVGNDLLFLSSQGVRSVTASGGSSNLQAGDIGMPVDGLVMSDLNALDRALPLATFLPGMGQYWLVMAEEPLHSVAITGAMSDGYVGDTGTYRYQINGGLAPIAVTISTGALPPGATIDDEGKVTFDYTTPGDYTWRVLVTGADGNTAYVDDGITISTLVMPAQSEWRYLQIGAADATDYSASAFDDSAWAVGTAPFGSFEDASYPGLDQAHDYDARFAAIFATPWTTNTRLWCRRTLTLAVIPTGGINLNAYIEDNFHVYVNGTLIVTSTPDPPGGNGQLFNVAAPNLVVGDNIIAVRCDDEAPGAGVSVVYFDLLLETE